MSLAARQTSLVADLLLIEDAQERLGALVDRARRRPPLPAAARHDADRVRGCQTPVWLSASAVDTAAGTWRVAADADSPLVRGLVLALVELVDGAAPADVAATELTLIEDLGLHRLLSPTRLNGLAAVRARLRALAQAAA